MEAEIRVDHLFLLIEKSIYNQDVLYKCFYWYSGSNNVIISDHSEKFFSVKLQPKTDLESFDVILEKIKCDLIDFKLRDIVTKETQTVRELIVAKAFAYYDLDDSPTTEVTDPVGFNPNKL